MNVVKASIAGIALLSALSFNAQAAYVSNIDIAGGFDVYNFNPLIPAGPGADLNPYTYNLDLHNVTGKAEFSVPPTGTYLEWFATGTATATYGGPIPLPPIVYSNDMIFKGPFAFGGFSATDYVFDFDTQTYSSMSGAFVVPLPGVPNILDVTYQILAFDADGIFNDVAISIVEMGFTDPMMTLSALLNVLDAPAPFGFGNGDGRIDGTFNINMQLNAVPEPATVLLLGLGLAGLAARRKSKQA